MGLSNHPGGVIAATPTWCATIAAGVGIWRGTVERRPSRRAGRVRSPIGAFSKIHVVVARVAHVVNKIEHVLGHVSSKKTEGAEVGRNKTWEIYPRDWAS